MKKLKCFTLSIVLLASFILLASCSNDNTESSDISSTTELTPESIYSLVSPSVVEISGTALDSSFTGSGFFYDEKGTVITNYHVIKNCQTATITLSTGTTYNVTSVLGFDENLDIAILSTECKETKPLKSRLSEISTGETVYVIGSSLGLSGSLSNGIVSAAKRNINGNEYIQTTAPMSHGNSGGPLIDKNGDVIGIVSASFSEGQNLNLAIPIGKVNLIYRSSPKTLSEFFNEHNKIVTSVGIRTISFSDKYTAEYIFAKWNNGDGTEDYMIELMDEYGAEQGGGQLYAISKGDFVEEVENWCFDPERQVGDVALIENAYGYSLCYISSFGYN